MANDDVGSSTFTDEELELLRQFQSEGFAPDATADLNQFGQLTKAEKRVLQDLIRTGAMFGVELPTTYAGYVVNEAFELWRWNRRDPDWKTDPVKMKAKGYGVMPVEGSPGNFLYWDLDAADTVEVQTSDDSTQKELKDQIDRWTWKDEPGLPTPTAGDLYNVRTGTPSAELQQMWRKHTEGWTTLGPGYFTDHAGSLVYNDPAFGPTPQEDPALLFRTDPQKAIDLLNAPQVATLPGPATHTNFLFPPAAPVSTGPGRSPRTFDRNQLLDEANAMWGGYLLTDPPPELAATINTYIKEANQFWLSAGGNLDFETFLMGHIRSNPRYGILYGAKPPNVTEAEWVRKYRNEAARYGLDPGRERTYAERGMRTGIGTAGLGSQIQRSGQFQAASGDFATRLGRVARYLGGT